MLPGVEPTTTLVTNDFIRDEIATLPSATPYQRGITSERAPSFTLENEYNLGNYMVRISLCLLIRYRKEKNETYENIH